MAGELMLHCGGKPVSRLDLAEIVKPEETESYIPVGHLDLMLEGQVAVLESGALSDREALALVEVAEFNAIPGHGIEAAVDDKVDHF